MSKTYGPYSSAREAGGLVFIAGQIGVDPNTKTAGASLREQMNQVFANLENVLAENNLTKAHIVNVRVYLTDMSQFEEMNTMYTAYFSSSVGPSRECIGVAALPSVAGKTKLLVELSAVAERPS